MTDTSAEEIRTTLLIITSERKLYFNALAASLRLLRPKGIDHILIVDTSLTDRKCRGGRYLDKLDASIETIRLPGLSFHRVLRHAWTYLLQTDNSTHVLMFEEDFLPIRRFSVNFLIDISNRDGTLQVVMPRQRWFNAERQFPNRQAYLRERHQYRETLDGDRLSGFFTSNPHCMRLDRVVPLLAAVEPSDDYNWELQYGKASELYGLGSLQLAAKRPWVWHIGAATSFGVRAAISRNKPTFYVYLKAHVKRSYVIAFHLIQERISGARK